jgi:hypothetical protein
MTGASEGLRKNCELRKDAERAVHSLGEWIKCTAKYCHGIPGS